MYSQSKRAAVSHFLYPPNIFFSPHFMLKYFSSRLLILECFFPPPFLYRNSFIASFLSRLIFLVPSSPLNTIFPHLFLPRNIYRSPLSSLNITFSHLVLSRKIFLRPFFITTYFFSRLFFYVEMFLLVCFSSVSIIFPRLFLSRNIFLFPFPLQTLFPRLFLSRHFSQFVSSFVSTISLNHFAILGQCIVMYVSLRAVRWRQHISTKCWYLSTTLHSTTSQKTTVFIFLTVTIADPMYIMFWNLTSHNIHYTL